MSRWSSRRSCNDADRGVRDRAGRARGAARQYMAWIYTRKPARVERGLYRLLQLVDAHVEPPGRPETEALVAGLPAIPRRTVEHRGVQLTELDLDAALAKRPRRLVVDELAHTNAPGSKHVKRWQDVLELLDAGIDVHTTI